MIASSMFIVMCFMVSDDAIWVIIYRIYRIPQRDVKYEFQRVVPANTFKFLSLFDLRKYVITVAFLKR